VRRVAQRLGFSQFDDPEKIEIDLMALAPQSEWFELGNMLVWHGRKICDARKPDCLHCPVQKLCPSAEEFLKSKR
jgi:endonuclease-3